jgi:bidirectional [NiFe] hydrogenase diaphorase subunit
MTTTFLRAAAPSTDKRWKIVDAAMRRNGHRPDGLIESLHAAQDAFGYLDEGALRYVASSLGVPLSKVYGVATFYHIFTLKPQGRHTCVVCMGTACYIRGAPALMEAARAGTGVKPGETTEDGRVSLLDARCLGSCGLAPAVVLDGEVHGKVSSDDLGQKIAAWMGEP